MTEAPESQQLQAATDRNFTRPGFTPWLDGGTRILRRWNNTNSAVLQSGFGFARRMTSFSEGHVRANLDLWKTLSGCGNVDEDVTDQSSRLELTTSDYLGQVKELTDDVLGAVKGATKRLFKSGS